jgi:hypothetical protein
VVDLINDRFLRQVSVLRVGPSPGPDQKASFGSHGSSAVARVPDDHQLPYRVGTVEDIYHLSAEWEALSQ